MIENFKEKFTTKVFRNNISGFNFLFRMKFTLFVVKKSVEYMDDLNIRGACPSVDWKGSKRQEYQFTGCPSALRYLWKVPKQQSSFPYEMMKSMIAPSISQANFSRNIMTSNNRSFRQGRPKFQSLF